MKIIEYKFFNTMRESFELSSGKIFEANQRVIGIDDVGEVFEGYDGGIITREFSNIDHIELANYMIDRWVKYKEQHGG